MSGWGFSPVAIDTRTMLACMQSMFWSCLFLFDCSFLVIVAPLPIEFSRSQETPALIQTLSGKNVVFIAAGGSHSAAITEGGALYTWGRGSFGRLGHGV